MNTGLIVALLGVVVCLAAWSLAAGTMFGAGSLGFGLGHIVLGVLDAIIEGRNAKIST